MNKLLERLEHQKEKLPVEDHSIIDWGINFVKAKMQEEEYVMAEKIKALFDKYREELSKVNFTRLPGNDLNLHQIDRLNQKVTKSLIHIICASNYDDSTKINAIKDNASKFKRIIRTKFTSEKSSEICRRITIYCETQASKWNKFAEEQTENKKKNASYELSRSYKLFGNAP